MQAKTLHSDEIGLKQIELFKQILKGILCVGPLLCPMFDDLAPKHHVRYSLVIIENGGV